MRMKFQVPCFLLWLTVCGFLLPAKGDDIPIHFLRVPENGVQPQAAMDEAGTLHLVYLRGDPQASDIYYVRRAAGETNFSKPLRVNSQPGSAVAMGAVRGAQLSLGRNGIVHVIWNGSAISKAPPRDGAVMLYARLEKPGEQFSRQRNVMMSTTGLDGGGSVAADARGNVYAVWHGRKKSDAEGEENRAVYVARSADDGKTFAEEQRANSEDTGACGCCGLKAYAEPEGRFGIVYRSADPSGHRDAILLLSNDGGKSFHSTKLGSWKMSSCPMSNQALGAGPNGTLIAMWESQGQIYHATTAAGELTPVPARNSPDGNPGHRKYPTFAISGSQEKPWLVAWTEGESWGKSGNVAWEYVFPNPTHTQKGSRGTIPPGTFPALATEKDGSFLMIY